VNFAQYLIYSAAEMHENLFLVDFASSLEESDNICQRPCPFNKCCNAEFFIALIFSIVRLRFLM